MDGCLGQVSCRLLGNSRCENKPKTQDLGSSGLPLSVSSPTSAISLLFCREKGFVLLLRLLLQKSISRGELSYAYAEQILAKHFAFLCLQTYENEPSHDFSECGLQQKLSRHFTADSDAAVCLRHLFLSWRWLLILFRGGKRLRC